MLKYRQVYQDHIHATEGILRKLMNAENALVLAERQNGYEQVLRKSLQLRVLPMAQGLRSLRVILPARETEQIACARQNKDYEVASSNR